MGRGYQAIPIAITVEGANILTRSLIIFGQGAIRCHPFVLKEMNAARNPDRAKGVDEFDRALFGHIGFTISNAVRSFIMSMTNARFASVPVKGPTARYYQHIVRFSASFAFVVDVAMLTLGGYLKKKENLSARLGDVLSCMYLASMVLKHYENQGRHDADLPVVEWACRSLLYRAQEQLHLFLRNFPNPMLGGVMRLLTLPRGLTVFRAKRPARRDDRRSGEHAQRIARARLPLHLQDGGTDESAGPAAGSAGAVADGGADREAHPRRRREDGQGDRARSAGSDRSGTRRRHHLGDGSRVRFATTTARSWTSSTSTTSRRTSWARRRSPSRSSRRPRPSPAFTWLEVT